MTANTTSLTRFTRRGFTLIELLVVIGIIVVLISILVPVVASAQRSARAADSRNQIKNIANAVDRYYNDFAAYPGIFSNSQISTGVTVTYNGPAGSVSQTLTSSENLVLSLCGGMTAGTSTTATAISSDVGRGALTMGTGQRRIAPYIEATTGTLSIPGAKLDRGATFGNSETSTKTMGVNNGVPEFLDRFGGAMPILYFRANVGAKAGIVSATFDSTYQYSYNEFANYIVPNAITGVPGKPPNPPKDFSDWAAYFTNSSLVNTAKQLDTYILISPGPDRTYGTADDICNFQF